MPPPRLRRSGCAASSRNARRRPRCWPSSAARRSASRPAGRQHVRRAPRGLTPRAGDVQARRRGQFSIAASPQADRSPGRARAATRNPRRSRTSPSKRWSCAQRRFRTFMPIIGPPQRGAKPGSSSARRANSATTAGRSASWRRSPPLRRRGDRARPRRPVPDRNSPSSRAALAGREAAREPDLDALVRVGDGVVQHAGQRHSAALVAGLLEQFALRTPAWARRLRACRPGTPASRARADSATGAHHERPSWNSGTVITAPGCR